VLFCVTESGSPGVNRKLIGEVCVAGRLSHNEEERYIAVMKELQFGEPSSLSFYRYCNWQGSHAS